MDDTDIIHLDMREDQEVEVTHIALRDSVHNWGQLLMATGGAFKPIKCFYHIISFKWKPNGAWDYEKNERREDLDIDIPMPDGSFVPIEHLSVDAARETLGVYTCPSGKSTGHIKAMKDKAQSWIDRAKEGHMRRRDVWFLLDRQLWPKVGYGLSSLSAPWKELEGCLKSQWWQLVPMGGLI